MAKIIEEVVLIKLNKLVKNSENSKGPLASEEMIL